MNFTIEKEIFLKGLSRIQGIVEKKNTIPILSNVLIETDDNQIIITATDLEVGMKSNYIANIKEPGKITVSARKILEIIKELPDKEISFKTKENSWIEIKCGKSLFNIVGLTAEEFPSLPSIEKINFIKINADLLSEMIEKTIFSITQDESKYNLNGIYFKYIKTENKENLRLIATDGHRLSLIDRNVENINIDELKKGAIFPKKGLHELKKIAEEGDSLEISFVDNSAIIRKNTTIIIMRLVDGEFPDYERVIPKLNENVIIVNRENLLHALKRISILSSEKSKGVKLNFKKNILEISSSNPEFGDAREEVEIKYEGQEIQIGFNARYLIDIFQTQTDEKIKIILKDNLSPGMIKPENDPDYLAVVMPMRL